MKKILFLSSNEKDYIHYIIQLEDIFTVQCNGFIQTVKCLVENNDFDLVVLDIPIPPSGLFSPAETDNGKKTGIIFFDKVLKGKNTPVVFWIENRMDKYKVEGLRLENPKHKIGFIQKTCEKNHLFDYVKDFLN